MMPSTDLMNFVCSVSLNKVLFLLRQQKEHNEKIEAPYRYGMNSTLVESDFRYKGSYTSGHFLREMTMNVRFCLSYDLNPCPAE